MKLFTQIEAAVILAGLLAISIVGYSLYLITTTQQQLLPLIQISNDLKVKVGAAHLWFEEALEGDETVDLQADVFGNIDQTIALAKMQIEQTKSIDRELYEKTKPLLGLLVVSLQEWRLQTEARWKNRADSSPGSPSDQAYDAKFQRVLLMLDENKSNVDEIVIQRQSLFSRLNLALILFLLFVFTSLTVTSIHYRRIMEAKNRESDRIEKELMHSREMKMLGQLASVVAHEVRNPLNAILAIAEAMFQDFGDRKEYSEYLSHIRNQTKRLSGIMQELLQLGKPIPHFTMHRALILDLCKSSIDVWKQDSRNDSNPVQIVPLYDGESPAVYVHRGKFQQVLVNLFDNAAQHSPAGSEIRLVLHKPQNNHIRVSVQDQGAGLGQEDPDRIFEPFFTTRKTGTGLGMSIVKHIVETHGGRVSIKNSEPGPGCIVDVTLPLAKEEGNETENSTDR